MLRASLKSLWARKIRLLLSAFAVVLGVTFVVGSFIFTDTLKAAFNGLTNGAVGDVIVRVERSGEGSAAGGGGGPGGGAVSQRRVPASLVAQLAEVEGAARADGRITNFRTFPVGSDRKLIGSQGAPGIGANYSTGPAANGAEMAQLLTGRWPAKPGEVVVDPLTLERSGYAVGQSMGFVTSGSVARFDATIVGTARFGSGGLLGASLAVLDTTQAQEVYFEGENVFNAAWVTRAPGVSQEQLRANVEAMLPDGYEAVTGDQSSAETKTRIEEALSFITTFLLVFAAVALFVGSFLIVNTFSILVAQRSRELALLRAIGASRRQVGRSVLIEALLVGLVGSVLGMGAGYVLAWGIRAVLSRFGIDLSGTELVVNARTPIAALVIGVLVTVVAAYLPARRAGRVPPVAAMRDDLTITEGSLGVRVTLGVLLAAVGVGALWFGTQSTGDTQIAAIGGGILAIMLGAVMSAPLVGRPLIALVGVVTTSVFGMVGRMARRNAARNPRRTAATASALMIGVTLVTMMNVIGDSASASIDKTLGEELTSDYVLSSIMGGPFSASIGDKVEAVPGVAGVARLRVVRGSVDGDRTGIGAVTSSAPTTTTKLTMTAGSAALDQNTILVVKETAADGSLQIGQDRTVNFRGAEQTFRIGGFYERSASIPTNYVISLEGLQRFDITPTDNALWVNLAPGADRESVQSALKQLVADVPSVSLSDQQAFAAERRKPIDTMLSLITALLGLAIVIAVLGIVNTLALSVIERTREIGLLRAVGLSRAQLQGMLWLESLVIAVLGAVVGVGLGTAFGVVLQRTFAEDGLSVLVIPWGGIITFVAIAAVVGILAALWPGRRAAKIDILRAIASE